MSSPYIVNITNGVGTKAILNGDYSVALSANGYDNTSILPISQTISAGVNEYDFTVSATGTLTLHVTETGIVGGAPVVGATFARCDSSGNVYGSPATSNASGNADFPFVPFAATSAPLIYYKQTASDGDHEFDPTLRNTSMTTSTSTVQVQNAPPATRTLDLTDANYAGLPIGTATLTLS